MTSALEKNSNQCALRKVSSIGTSKEKRKALKAILTENLNGMINAEGMF